MFLVAPGDLLDTVLEEENSGNATRAEAILCGAVKQLRASQGRPEPTLYLALMSLARAKSTLFMRTRVLDVRLVYTYDIQPVWPSLAWKLSMHLIVFQIL